MQNYHFFLEWANRRIAQQYTVPDKTIRAATIQEAVKRFGNNKHLKLSGWEPLIGEGWRAYYMSKGEEHVYYVEEAP